MKLVITTKTNEYLSKVLLNSLDSDVISICIDDIYLLMSFGHYEIDSNIIKKDFEMLGVLEKLSKLTTHENDDISNKAVLTIEEFWKK